MDTWLRVKSIMDTWLWVKSTMDTWLRVKSIMDTWLRVQEYDGHLVTGVRVRRTLGMGARVR